MKHEYYRLVRDKIPEIMTKEGNMPRVVALGDKDYRNELDLKLKSECEKLLSTHDIVEFVDILEVLEAIAKDRKISWETILSEKEKKANQKGRFDKKIFLEYTEG